MRWLFMIVWVCGCLDEPLKDDPPTAHVIASWDPLACGAPHRVVVELADSSDTPLSVSAPCTLGELVFDTPHFGDYNGRVYAYAPGLPDRSESPVELVVDQPIVHWPLETPR